MYFRRRSGLGLLGLVGYYGWRNRSQIRNFVGNNEQLRGIFSRFGFGGGSTSNSGSISSDVPTGSRTIQDELLKKVV